MQARSAGFLFLLYIMLQRMHAEEGEDIYYVYCCIYIYVYQVLWTTYFRSLQRMQILGGRERGGVKK